MKITHNLTAMNISRNFSVLSRQNQKTTEKLSSGYRINRAADDAAGLSMSEKMRRLIRGLRQASENAQDGVSLIQTADGALEETQQIIQRMNELSVKAGNDTLSKEDTDAIQQEIDQLLTEIDRIASTTEFNTVKLLDGSLDDNRAFGSGSLRFRSESLNGEEDPQALEPLVSFYSYTTSSIPEGGSTIAHNTQLANTLETQIVPQIVTNILNRYSAFSYLNGSEIGIGLRLYNQNSNTLAYVSAAYQEQNDGGAVKGSKTYQLGVNLNHLELQSDGSLTTRSREELEATIAHEMVHAFMAEATTNGMLGGDRFPLWFVEGMAQTAAGDGGWISSLSSASSDAAIRSFLSKIGPGYSPSDGAANYGAGYLADMYLGYMAGTGGSMEARITDGLNKIMNTVIAGSSLDKAIAQHTKYKGLTDFSNNVRNDTQACQFVRDLISATGSGRGGLVTGDLTASDLAADFSLTNVDLFRLDKTHERVKNIYSGDYVILSGGGAHKSPPPPGTYPGSGMGSGGPGRSGGIFIQTGTESADKIKISIAAATTADLGLTGLNVNTTESAGWAIESCKLALQRVSENRATLGASQNRLEHTIANLDNTVENTQAAESLIRDTDMANEMVAHSCRQIVMQAAYPLLAQANQSPQSVLALLS